MGLDDLTWGDPKFTTVVDNGDPKNRLDIAIIGDGYASGEERIFQADAQSVIDAYRNYSEPFKTYIDHLNFHRVDVISRDSGTSDAYADPPRLPRTALDTYYSSISERRLLGPDEWVKTVVLMSGAPADAVVVIVNSPRNGAATQPSMKVAYASRNDLDFPSVVIHETGHSIAKLMDEYSEASLKDIDWPTNWVFPPHPPWPNVDHHFTQSKWSIWLTPDVELPTPDNSANDGNVGAFQGAAYLKSGAYRPMRNCAMRNNGTPFCRVCIEQWIKRIYGFSKLADSFSPDYNDPHPPIEFAGDKDVVFSARLVRSANIVGSIRTTWWTRKGWAGSWTQRQQTDNYTDFTTSLPATIRFEHPIPTYWEVKCLLEDRSSLLRTPAIRQLASQQHKWRIITQ